MNTLDLFRLDGKTAIVTGGGRGLGRYMAGALSDAEANVLLCSRKLHPLRVVQQESRLAVVTRSPSSLT